MKLNKIDWYSVYKKWNSNSGVFEYLFKSSPFVTAKYMEGFELREEIELSISKAIQDLLRSKIQTDTLLIVDVETRLGISAAIILNNDFNVAPILSYNFLFHPYGIVGSKELIEELVYGAEAIRLIEPSNYAFILDSNRYVNDFDISNPNLFNNQYEITEEEMPDIDMLKTLGKSKICFFYFSSIKEDINCYLEYLRNNNFEVNTVNLGDVINE